MLNNTKLLRWLVPCSLLILLAVSILAINFTSPPKSDTSLQATVVALQQTVTALVHPRPTPTPSPISSPTRSPAPLYRQGCRPVPLPNRCHIIQISNSR
jgi:hypothetical protein